MFMVMYSIILYQIEKCNITNTAIKYLCKLHSPKLRILNLGI